MSHSTARETLITACIEALPEAESVYAKWTGGITMRSAPESLVQTKIAEHLARNGDIVVLEVSVKDVIAVAQGKEIPDLSRGDRGRIDIAVYYKSKGTLVAPRFVVEIKKLTDHHSLDQDYNRIIELMHICPDIQNGIMVGYGTAAKPETALRKIHKVTEHLPCKRVRTLEPIKVIGKDQRPRYLAAAVYRIDRV